MSAEPDSTKTEAAEQSLDPQDWEQLRALGHETLDDMIEYLRTVAERPVWQALPADSKAFFEQPIPRGPSPNEQVYEQIRDKILPYPTGNIHPRFWSWVGGTGTPTQLIADMVISAMNAASLGFDEVASSRVEVQLLGWLKELLDYPRHASGLLVSGGSMANLVGLAVARTHTAPYDVREHGLDVHAFPRQIYYASAEAHSSIRKAIELLGLGTDSLRSIPVDEDFTINVGELERAIAADRKSGHQPACIVATAGTVNTGATDPLHTMADIAERENMWLHTDAAFGGFAKLSPDSRHIVDGLERADSLTFDLHKWLYVQYDCGCVLIKSAESHRETFSVIPSYIRKLDRGLASGPVNFSEYGVQLSRSFKALRAWTGLKTEGADRYGQQIEQNIQQARYLERLVVDDPHLELLAPTPMNIVNFRFLDATMDDAALNDLNVEILLQLQERGIAAPSSTELNGRFSIRVAICNHRSRRSDFRALAEAVVRLGRELSRGAA